MILYFITTNELVYEDFTSLQRRVSTYPREGDQRKIHGSFHHEAKEASYFGFEFHEHDGWFVSVGE